MGATTTFRIAVIGFPEAELRVLRNILRLSAVRTRSYDLAERDALPLADIVIVDGDQPNAITEWQTAYAQRPVPSLVVSAEGKTLEGERITATKRPIIPSRLLALLDQITVRELRMPEPVAAAAKPAGPRTVSPAQPPSRSRFAALVVDDSPTVRKQIELGLRPLGIVAEFAETGEEALERLAKSTYDLIFLDVVLPGTDGYQVCKAIKRDKAQKHTPVVMLTSKSSPFDRIRGSLAGCDSYLTKPVELDVFRGVVNKYLAAIEDHRGLGERDWQLATTRSS